MKIIADNAVYVQKNDIAYLSSSDIAINYSIFMKVFGNGIVIIDDSNRYEFVKFEDKSEIEFFKNIDWMIDYNEVKDLSEEQLLELGRSIAEEKNKIARSFNSMSSEDKNKNMDMVTACELLDFKMYSLRDIIWFKQGHIDMELPRGIDYPKGYVKKKGIKRFFGKRK